MRYRRTPEFIDNYNALPGSIKAKIKKAFKLFKQDQRHPSLHIKKVKGLKGVFEGRIDRKHRFTFHYDEEGVVFRKIGPHRIVDEEAQDN